MVGGHGSISALEGAARGGERVGGDYITLRTDYSARTFRSLIEINYFLLPYFSLMGFFAESRRRLGSAGLLEWNWNFLPLPTGAATRIKGSCTVGASLFLLGGLSSKIWAFWGYYSAVRDAESDVGAALRRDGGAASYAGPGFVVE